MVPTSSPDKLPQQPPDPPECGPHAVQVLRTYPDAHFEYDFAPRGERSVARGYSKAVRRARRLLYLEDQYLWSKRVAQLFARALQENPDLHLVAVVPRYPDVDGRLALPPNMIGRRQAIDACKEASPQRVHIFDVENHVGTPVYVHAKVCVVDDVWAVSAATTSIAGRGRTTANYPVPYWMTQASSRVICGCG